MYIDIDLEETKQKLRALPIEEFLTVGKDVYDLEEELKEYTKDDLLFDNMSTYEFAEFIAEEYDILVQEVMRYEIGGKTKEGCGRIVIS